MVARRRMTYPIAAIAIVAVVSGLLLVPPRLRIWMCMRPYYQLVDRRATEDEIVAREGPPNKVLTGDAELRDFARSQPPFGRMPMHVKSKVLIYWARPWQNIEGYAVYVFLDEEGRAYEAVMGGG